jgi:hypothetical protein
MQKKLETDHYDAEINIELSERNVYGDDIGNGVITIHRKVKVMGAAGLGYLLVQLDETLKNVKIVNA